MKNLLIVLAVLIGLAAAWAMWPRGTSGATTNMHTPGGFTQQPVGESKAGRSQNMPPAESAGRGDTAESGQRAQKITATASGDMPLSEQTQRVSEYFRTQSATGSDDKFGIAIGASVPRQIGLQPLPSELVDVMGKFYGDEYVLVNGRLIVVEPKVRRIVAIIPLT
jgi:hypothetical protein